MRFDADTRAARQRAIVARRNAEERAIDGAVLQAVVALTRAGLQAIAEAASEIAGQEIHHRRFVEPNVRSSLDRLDAAGLVHNEGYLAGKAATVATDTGRRRAGRSA